MTRRNLHIYFYRFFGEFVPIMPLLGVFFIDRGLTLSEASIVFLILSITVFALEIPTGVLADMTSPRTVLIFSRLFKLFAFGCILHFPNFYGFAVGFALWGMSSALDSGSFQSYLFTYTKQVLKSEAYTRMYSRSSTAGLLGLLFSSILITQFQVLGYETLQIIGVISLIISLVLAFTLPTLVPTREYKNSLTPFTLVRKGLHFVSCKKILLILLGVGILAGGIKGSLDEYAGIMLNEKGMLIAILGFTLFGLELLTSFGAMLAGWIKITTKWQLILLAVFGTMFLGIGLIDGFVIPAILLGLIVVVDGILWIHNDASIQEHAHDDYRATIGSIKNFGTEALAMLVFVSVAVWDIVNVSALYIVLGVIMAGLSILLGVYGFLQFKIVRSQ